MAVDSAGGDPRARATVGDRGALRVPPFPLWASASLFGKGGVSPSPGVLRGVTGARRDIDSRVVVGGV